MTKSCILSNAFLVIIRRWFQDDATVLLSIDALNRAWADDPALCGFCASNDYCDALAAMSEAWDSVFPGPMDITCTEDVNLWTTAWAISQRRGFSTKESSFYGGEQ